MTKNQPRSDVPLHLPESYATEAEDLRNKLLMFRFRNLKKYSVTQIVESGLEPRISQIFAPLLTLMENEKERGEVLELISDYSKELSLDRSIDLDSRVLETVNELWNGEPLPLRAITTRLNEKYAEDLQETISGKRVGFVVRKVLGIRTRKRGGLFEILPTERGRVDSNRVESRIDLQY